ncbi:MAG: hypothetical protein A2X64_02910 [Ignavibacteria bacterium GWF2_33_9]|nr:MAG: hypothetical protein A2X64_02910 [Ignavibacteria bacterium GWF2_33_9]
MFKNPVGLKCSEEFEYVPLTVTNLKQIVELVELRFKVRAFGFELKSIRPEKFGDIHNFDINKIYDGIENSPNIIRTYHIRFCNKNIGGNALVDFATLGMKVIAKSKFGDNDENEKKIILDSLNCFENDFNYFKKAVFEIVKFEKYYPPGKDVYDDVIARFTNSDFIDDESKMLITGAISNQQYELAIKAISGLVESRLRNKLESLGVSSAANSAGIELAKLAYNKNSGCLIPPWPIAKESNEGAHLLLSGYMLWIRNGFHHQTKIFTSKEGVLELLALSCALLRIINLSTRY